MVLCKWSLPSFSYHSVSLDDDEPVGPPKFLTAKKIREQIDSNIKDVQTKWLQRFSDQLNLIMNKPESVTKRIVWNEGHNFKYKPRSTLECLINEICVSDELFKAVPIHLGKLGYHGYIGRIRARPFEVAHVISYNISWTDQDWPTCTQYNTELRRFKDVYVTPETVRFGRSKEPFVVAATYDN